MKLLFVVHEYGGAKGGGGIATFYNHLLPGLVKAGCEVDVCLVPEPGTPAEVGQRSGVRVFCTDQNLIQQALARLPQFSSVPDLQHALARAFAAYKTCDGGGGYDVVETTDWNFLYVPWVIQGGGPPVVVQLHASNGQIDYYDPLEGSGLIGLIARLLETSLLGRADELQSYGLANAVEWSRLLNKDVYHIWPAWQKTSGDTTKISPEVSAEGKGVVVGRLQSWKGPEVLCQAAELLGERAPKILWVGRDTPFRCRQRWMSAYLKESFGNIWEKTVLPVGEMSREITASMQAAAKFVVVPSRWDTFNLAAVEAMSARKVVICSEGAGVSSLIRHGENGFRFSADDPRRLAAVLAEVDNLSLEVRNQIGQNAHDTVARELDQDHICASRIDRYRRLKESKTTARCQHRWLDSLFDSEAPEPPFAFLSMIPTKHLANAIPTRQLAKLAFRRAWRRVRMKFFSRMVLF